MITLEQRSREPVQQMAEISIGRLERAEKVKGRTWRIVSKLNVSPFHKVNSPLVDPVKIRLASGVNYVRECQWLVCRMREERKKKLTVAILTGQRILFVEV